MINYKKRGKSFYKYCQKCNKKEHKMCNKQAPFLSNQNVSIIKKLILLIIIVKKDYLNYNQNVFKINCSYFYRKKMVVINKLYN